jgi:hypothetical protein
MFKTHDYHDGNPTLIDMYLHTVDTRIHEGNNEEENNGDVVFQWGNMVVVRGGGERYSARSPLFYSWTLKDDENGLSFTSDICFMLVSCVMPVPYTCSINYYS